MKKIEKTNVKYADLKRRALLKHVSYSAQGVIALSAMSSIANSNELTQSEIRARTVDKGSIVVQGDTSTTIYQCIADGVADDRDTILRALRSATDDMPAVVTFGPGNYGISGGIRISPAPGSRGLDIKGQGSSTRIRFNKGSALSGGQQVALDIRPLLPPVVGDYADYIKDITVAYIAFFDDDPDAHEGGTGEESHAVSIKYTQNAVITNCRAYSIGDEAFNFSFVHIGAITNNITYNTPSLGVTGSPITVQMGSSSILIEGNILQGSSIPGVRSTVTLNSGIALQITAGLAYNLDLITITNNIIRDFDRGISANNAVAGTELKNITITNNAIENCGKGIAATGGNLHQYFNMVGNLIRNVDVGVAFNVGFEDNLDCTIALNKIENCTGRGIICNGQRLNLSDNNISNTGAEAILVWTALDVQINGGIIDSCGGTNIPCIRAKTDGKQVTVDGVDILFANSTTQVILNCERVRNCRIDQNLPHFRSIWSATEITNCSSNGGMHLDKLVTNGIISGNRIVATGDIGGDAIRLSGTNKTCIISNNFIDTRNTAGTHRHAIKLFSGSDSHVVTNNISITDGEISGILNNGAGNIVANNQDL